MLTLSAMDINSLPSEAPTLQRDPITCHVLDQTTGRPAPQLDVRLTLRRPRVLTTPFRAVTTADGRISNWNKWDTQAGASLAEIFTTLGEEPVECCLTFETEAYFGKGNTFFPKVDITFFVETKGGHYHVPLLLGPWSYTTYRGS